MCRKQPYLPPPYQAPGISRVNFLMYQRSKVSTIVSSISFQAFAAKRLAPRARPLIPAYPCSLAFGLITRRITKWFSVRGWITPFAQVPDPGGDVVRSLYSVSLVCQCRCSASLLQGSPQLLHQHHFSST